MDPAPGWDVVPGGGVSAEENVPACGGLVVPAPGAISEGFRGDEPDGVPGVAPATAGVCLGGVTVHHCPVAGV
jgi:hypothetical protein